MIKSSVIYKNTQNLDSDTTLMDAAMECAFFLEELGLLAYRNWDTGEVIDGPHITRFHTTITLMFSMKRLPDLLVLDRLKNMKCLLSYKKETYRRAVRFKENEEDDEYIIKKVDHDVWLLTIKIPNRYLALDGNTLMNIDGDDIYYDDIDVIYDGETEESMESESEDSFGGGGDDFGGFDDAGDDELDL